MSAGASGAGPGVHACEARAGVGLIEGNGIPSIVDQDERVVNDTHVAWAELDAADEARALEGDGEDEIPVNVLAFSGDGERLRHADNEVGFAQLPAASELWYGRRLGGISLRGTVVMPAPEQGDLVRGEPALADELSIALDRQPRWHRVIGRYLGNLFRALSDIFVRQERKRSGLAGAVAGGAVLEHYRSDVACEGGVIGDRNARRCG
jgi:hypothetical protein